jgi:hypothetical protein
MKRRIGYGILIASLILGNGLLLYGIVFASGDLGEDSSIRTNYRTEKIKNYIVLEQESDDIEMVSDSNNIDDEILPEVQLETEYVQEIDNEEMQEEATQRPEELLPDLEEEVVEENDLESESYVEETLPEEEPQQDEEPVEEIPVVKGSTEFESWEVPLWQNDPFTDSPEIYFHVKDEITLDLAIHIKDGVTKTIPEVDMGTRAEWNDLLVRPDGSIEYDGQIHSMLYYEGSFVHAYGFSNMGWEIAKIDGKLYFEGQQVTEVAILKILKLKMLTAGLEPDEISFILRRIMDNNMLEFETEYLYIRYIPQDSVDKAIQLKIPDYFSVMRRHFLLEASDDPMELEDPEFESVSGDFIIHETAVNRI